MERKPLNDEELAELEALEEMATPGPWRIGFPMWDGRQVTWTEDLGTHDIYRDGGPTYNPTWNIADKVAGNYDYEEGGIVHKADAHLIVKMRQHLRTLVAEVRQARAALATDPLIGERNDLRRIVRGLQTQLDMALSQRDEARNRLEAWQKDRAVIASAEGPATS